MGGQLLAPFGVNVRVKVTVISCSTYHLMLSHWPLRVKCVWIDSNLSAAVCTPLCHVSLRGGVKLHSDSLLLDVPLLPRWGYSSAHLPRYIPRVTLQPRVPESLLPQGVTSDKSLRFLSLEMFPLNYIYLGEGAHTPRCACEEVRGQSA